MWGIKSKLYGPLISAPTIDLLGSLGHSRFFISVKYGHTFRGKETEPAFYTK